MSPRSRRGGEGRRAEPLEQDAYDAAVVYLANRPRSVAEIQRHLKRKKFDDPAIERAIDKLRAQRYVDDDAFAKYWLEQRARFRQKGDRALRSELLAKGVARDAIDGALGEREPDAELEQARVALRRPLTRWLTLDEGERKRKAHAYLVARGFSYDTIESVLLHLGEDDERG
ncbi:MAG: regulatory protein RecX [Chloroflexi bacterium]|nr:regulatory protein RecX [Chloroflexota bacterium]